MNKFTIKGTYITLGQLLKATGLIGSGGEAKFFLLDNAVFLNGERRTERGKKIYPGDVVSVLDQTFVINDDQNHQP